KLPCRSPVGYGWNRRIEGPDWYARILKLLKGIGIRIGTNRLPIGCVAAGIHRRLVGLASLLIGSRLARVWRPLLILSTAAGWLSVPVAPMIVGFLMSNPHVAVRISQHILAFIIKLCLQPSCRIVAGRGWRIFSDPPTERVRPHGRDVSCI